jgi:hypothetical protein
MLFHGMLERAQIEVLTADPTGVDLIVGRLWYRSDTKLFKVYDGTAVQEFVDLATAQTLQNKVLASPSITGFVDIQEVASPATPSAGNSRVYAKNDGRLYKKDDNGIEVAVIEGDAAGAVLFDEIASTPTTPGAGVKKVYAKNDGKMYTLNSAGEEVELGAGAGAGEVNFITNGKAEENTTGWATYQDVAGTRPVDGNGGAAVGVTFTRSTSSPLDGDASFLFSKDAANRQGEGASTEFLVAPAYRAKVLTIEADYIVSSGTFVAGTNTTDSDVIVYIYDVTNAVLIEPSSFKFLSNNTSISDKFSATFQTSPTGSNYRLIFHAASTSASAYVLKIDNIKVSPSKYVYGTPVTDWRTYVPTGTWTTNSNYFGHFRRVGDSAEIRARVTATAAPGSGVLVFNLPPGLVIDTTKVSVLATDLKLGSGNVLNAGLASHGVDVTYNTSTAVIVSYANSASANQLASITPTAPFTFGVGDSVNIEYQVPIVGWASSVQMSDQADTRVVAARVRATVGTSITSGSTTAVTFGGVDYDTHGGWDGVSTYNVKVSGKYRLSCAIDSSAALASSSVGLQYAIVVFKNGVQIGSRSEFTSTTTSKVHTIIHTDSFDFVSGDAIQIRFFHNLGPTFTTAVNANAGTNFIIERISGPSAISATESVNAKYTNTAATSIPNAAFTNIPFANRIYDSHLSWNGTQFVVQTSGKYAVNSTLHTVFPASTQIDYTIEVWVNGVYNTRGQRLIILTGTSATSHGISVATDVDVKFGDTIEIRGYQVSGASRSLEIGAGVNTVTIKRVGN